MSPPKSLSSSERKLRKLRRDPRLFFYDAFQKRAGAITDLAIRTATHLPLRGFVSTRRRYTVVTAVYNVEKYLDEFFQSIAGQTIAFDKHIELILVDDGSTDGSAAVIEKWRQKYPKSIRYFHKQNGGQASARNLGLAHATGDWITFIDPDDFVHVRYFEMVDRFLDANEDKPVAVVSCKWIFYYDDGKRFVDKHPLDYRFANGSVAVQHGPDADVMVPSAATSFFRADNLVRERLYFDEKIKPHFEDAHFAGRYLIRTANQYTGFVADAIYYYRKRSDGTSTLDRGWANPSRFSEVVERGYLGLLREANACSGAVPVFVQRLVLYDVFWAFKKIVGNASSVSFLTPAQVEAYKERLAEVFEGIDAATILQFSLAGCWFFHKVGWLGMYKSKAPPYQIVYIESYDPIKNVALLKYYYYGEPVVERFLVDGVEVVPSSAKVRAHDFLGSLFVYERRVRVKLGEGYSSLDAEIGGLPTKISLGSTQHEGGITRAMVERELSPRERNDPWPATRALRRLARSPEVTARFRDAWMFIDRDGQADDNAEHLYRYVKEHHPEINAFFVLSESSYDWPRLKDEGFRLIPFGSRDHHLLMLNARHVISSHPDSFVLHVLPAASYGDLLTFKFTFLQHGVIRDDISGWLNTKDIDLFVTSSPREHESIAGDRTPYKFDRAQTKMVGLSRHDALLAREEQTERVVLLMPTWRQYLVGAAAKGTTRRQPSPGFVDSTYAKAWRGVLHSQRLRELTERHGYRIVFFPHANMQLYVDAFDAPSWIDVRTHATEPVLQRLYRRAAVMVTDYSSVFFEMGLLDKPIIYYQFDRDEMYGGAHPSRLGYFDFDRDGFGPVALTEDDLLRELEAILERGCAPSDEHLRRMRQTLPLRDGRNRERTVAAIKALDEPRVSDDQSREIAMAQAEVASRRGAWEVAQARWDALVSSGARVDDDALVRLAQATRAVGRTREAEALLARVGCSSPEVELRVRIERAELASSRGDVEEAKTRWRELESADLSSAGLDAGHAGLALARLHRTSGELDAALQIVDALPSTRARDIERAELAMERREWRDAASLFARLAEPRSPDVLWLRAARAHQQLGELERATEVVAAYVRAGGTAPEATLIGVELLADQGKIDAARQRALALANGEHPPWPAEALLELARLSAKLGLFEVAERLLDASPPGARREMARLDVWAAAERWRAVAEVDPAKLAELSRQLRWRGELLIARAQREIGAIEAALASAARLRAEAPRAPEPLAAHAEALMAGGRWAEAAAIWEQHLAEHPRRDPQRVRARLAYALERLGRREESSRLLAESARANALERLQRDPNDPDAYRQLVQLMTVLDG